VPSHDKAVFKAHFRGAVLPHGVGLKQRRPCKAQNIVLADAYRDEHRSTGLDKICDGFRIAVQTFLTGIRRHGRHIRRGERPEHQGECGGETQDYPGVPPCVLAVSRFPKGALCTELGGIRQSAMSGVELAKALVSRIHLGHRGSPLLLVAAGPIRVEFGHSPAPGSFELIAGAGPGKAKQTQVGDGSGRFH